MLDAFGLGAAAQSSPLLAGVLWMLIGVAIFLLGDWAVDKRFGST